MSAVTRPLLRYHGGKWQMAEWLVAFFPPHQIYVEPFGGAASVLLRKPLAYAEIYNDLDGEIVNLFRVVRDRGIELVRAVELTPFAREEFDLAFKMVKDPLEQARRTVIRSYMGFCGNLTRETRNLTPQRTGFRNYSKKNRRSIPAHDWRTWPTCLPAIIDRLRGVVIEHRPASEVLLKNDGAETLHYVDPPYVHSTRRFDGSGHRGYRFEMTDVEHRALALLLRSLKGKVIVSGYPSDLYDRELYCDWHRVERPHVADGARPRTEVIWMNDAVLQSRRQAGLFA